MDALLKYAILGLLAAVSGFFLLGFIIYTAYTAIVWLRNKKDDDKEKLRGGLLGISINGLIFALTFPVILPVVIEAVKNVLLRFLD